MYLNKSNRCSALLRRPSSRSHLFAHRLDSESKCNVETRLLTSLFTFHLNTCVIWKQFCNSRQFLANCFYLRWLGNVIFICFQAKPVNFESCAVFKMILSLCAYFTVMAVLICRALMPRSHSSPFKCVVPRQIGLIARTTPKPEAPRQLTYRLTSRFHCYIFLFAVIFIRFGALLVFMLCFSRISFSSPHSCG